MKMHEAEPVAYIDKRGDFWSIDRAKAELEDCNLLDLRPVYAHPQSDKLRQAAKRYLNACDHGSAKERETYRELLRAALEGK